MDDSQIVEADAFTLPYRDLEIAAEIGGVVAFVAVEEGELVEEGQVLVRFKSDLLEARRLWQQAQVASAVVQISAEQTRCEVATQECDRMAGLFEKEVISDRDYVQARLEKDLADWRVRAAEAAVTASEAAVVLEEKRIEQTINPALHDECDRDVRTLRPVDLEQQVRQKRILTSCDKR